MFLGVTNYLPLFLGFANYLHLLLGVTNYLPLLLGVTNYLPLLLCLVFGLITQGNNIILCFVYKSQNVFVLIKLCNLRKFTNKWLRPTSNPKSYTILYEPPHDETIKMACAPMLIRVFADAQADLSLRCALNG